MRWPGWRAERWDELLTTDSGYGKLGTMDTHIVRENLPAVRLLEVPLVQGNRVAQAAIDNSTTARVRTRRPAERISLYYSARVTQSVTPTHRSNSYGLGGISKEDRDAVPCAGERSPELPRSIRASLPKWLRSMPPTRIIEWILQPIRHPVAGGSIYRSVKQYIGYLMRETRSHSWYKSLKEGFETAEERSLKEMSTKRANAHVSNVPNSSLFFSLISKQRLPLDLCREASD